jgi:hypothetical protein
MAALTSGLPLPAGAPAAVATKAPAWIQSAPFDLAFFVLAPVLTLPLVFGALHLHNGFALAGFVLAFAHYLSSFTFYFWDENKDRTRRRWMAFFGGPLAITAIFWLLVTFRVPLVIQFVLFFWNAVHVARQSCGILSIYRHRAGVSGAEHKSAANGAIVAVSLWLCLWNIETHAEVEPVLRAIWPGLSVALRAAGAAVAAAFVARAVAVFRRRAADGIGARGPELAAFATGLLLFHPYAWIDDSGRATFAMLLPHYVQYLGLVWLLHRRKFTRAEGSRAQALLQRVGARNAVLLPALAASGLAFFAAKELLTRMGHLEFFEACYLLIAFLHFYSDGLFWAFRDPEVRRSLGPFLLRGPKAASTA